MKNGAVQLPKVSEKQTPETIAKTLESLCMGPTSPPKPCLLRFGVRGWNCVWSSVKELYPRKPLPYFETVSLEDVKMEDMDDRAVSLENLADFEITEKQHENP